MSRVLIAGCGYVGTALGVELAAEGTTVWGLRRDPSRLPPSIRPIQGDLLDAQALPALIPPDLDAVVYAASAGGFSDDAYRTAYVDGVGILLSALVRAGSRPGRVLFTSSTGVYGHSDGARVDERTPPEPLAFNGTRVLEGESLILSGPFPGVVLRLGGIYGPGRTALLERVRSGEATCPPEPVWSNRIHRDDCAGALRHLLTLEDPESVYIGVDRDPADLCTVMTWLARRLGVEPPGRSAGGRGGRNSNKQCSSDRLAASGYTFRHPSYRDGFAALLDDLSGASGAPTA